MNVHDLNDTSTRPVDHLYSFYNQDGSNPKPSVNISQHGYLYQLPHQHIPHHQPPHPHPNPHLYQQTHVQNTERPSALDQIQDDTPIDEEPLYVNAKQYFRILKRRVARARLEEVHRLSKQRKVERLL